MTSLDSARPSIQRGVRERTAHVTLVFGFSLFASALLLFSVQPMFTKMILPKLGGAPSVWSVAMVSFQAFLFAGYLYAHLLSRALSQAWAGLVHLSFLALVTFCLPLSITSAFGAPPADNVMPWLIAVFAASIGLPFVALSATAPLMQSWFSQTRHPAAVNPYVLYATSNFGSFAALLAYPLAIEPFLTLQQQTAIWSVGFAILALLIAVAAVLTMRFQAAYSSASAPVSARPTLKRRATWMALTAVPAGLCISVTSYITTDIAAAPFIWIIPLAVYLLTFVAVFRSAPWLPHAAVLRYLPYVVAPLAVSILGGAKSYWFASMTLNLVAFLGIALACHGEAYRQRPDNDRLTEFYLWTSLGGVIGGIFAGLLAPYLFKNIYEYPLLICLGLAMLPGTFAGGLHAALRQAWIPIALIVGALTARFGFNATLSRETEIVLRLVLIAIAAAMLCQTTKQARFLALVVLAFVVSGTWRAGLTTIETARSFFGVHQIVETHDRTVRALYHGVTLHGLERVRSADGTPHVGRPELLSYYYPGSPFADAIDSVRAAQGGLAEVAVVGLGPGTLACHRQSNEHWSFFEIDPEVVRIARDPQRFRFLSECAPDAPMVVGDARLTLSATPKLFNLIIMDAFSSNAIPTHLLTREAIVSYFDRLGPHGALVIHVSNQHLELASVVAAIAEDASLVAYTKRGADANDLLINYRANGELVVLARKYDDLGKLPVSIGWHEAKPNGTKAWTDDYSNLLQAMLRKMGGM